MQFLRKAVLPFRFFSHPFRVLRVFRGSSLYFLPLICAFCVLYGKIPARHRCFKKELAQSLLRLWLMPSESVCIVEHPADEPR